MEENVNLEGLELPPESAELPSDESVELPIPEPGTYTPRTDSLGEPNVRIEDSPELTISYDDGDGLYRYEFPNGSAFLSNIPLGSMSNEAVTVAASDGAYIVRYSLDNAILKESSSESEIKEFNADRVGGYGFLAESYTNNGVLWEIYDSRMSFKLVREDLPVQSDFLKAPYGYRIGEIRLDGEALPLDNEDYIRLTEDGSYSAIFLPKEIEGAPDYSVLFKRDTAAPRIIFSKDISGEETEGPVYFSSPEPGTSIEVYLNGGLLAETPDAVAAGGEYRIVSSDPYGNSRDYYFTLKSVGSTPYPLYFGVALAFALVAVLVAVFSRNDLKVL